MTSQTFVLPFPPSTNSMWKHRSRYYGQVYLSERYRKWRDIAGKELIAQGAKKVSGPVRIVIGLCPGHARKWDGDNFTKPLFDLLKNCAVIEDDNSKIIREYTVHCDPPGLVGAQVTITPVIA